MRTVEEIRADYQKAMGDAGKGHTYLDNRARKLRAELVDALTKGMGTDRLTTICEAERAGGKVCGAAVGFCM